MPVAVVDILYDHHYGCYQFQPVADDSGYSQNLSQPIVDGSTVEAEADCGAD